MKIDDGGGSRQMQRILADMGGQKWDGRITIQKPIIKRMDLTSDDLKGILHESGLLIYQGQPCFAYIRDQTVHHGGWGDIESDVSARRRLHFSVCSTLQGMQKSGRFESRYRMTTRTDDMYAVDVPSGKTVDLRLWPCENCLKYTNYRCFESLPPRDEQVKRILKDAFKAADALSLSDGILETFKQASRGLRHAQSYTGYVRHWAKISQRARNAAGWKCAQCNVLLSDATWLLDVHHKDGDKSRNDPGNLECLCKLCHQQQHLTHYAVSDEPRRIIEQKRQEQGLDAPK